jgi:hypothetical protein
MTVVSNATIAAPQLYFGTQQQQFFFNYSNYTHDYKQNYN